MERLTEYDFEGKIAAPKELVKDGCAFLCSKICNNYIDNNGEINVCRNCPVQKCFDKLAKYEDTGLEPNDIYDLQKNIRNLQIKYDSLNKSFDAKVEDYYHLQDQFMEALAQVGIITIHGEE